MVEPIQTDGNVNPKCYHYVVKQSDGQKINLAVIATSNTAAHMGIAQNFPGSTVSFEHVSDFIIQVNDNSIIDTETKEIVEVNPT